MKNYYQLTLFEYINTHHRPSLRYIDAKTGHSYNWEEMSSVQLPVENTTKQLCFLYLDNSVACISIFFSLLRTPHCVCLLSGDLKEELKENLESTYSPGIIIDAKRDAVTGYLKRVAYTPDNVLLPVYINDKVQHQIHPALRILLPTSGTTGSPKLVKLTDENFISNATSILGYLPITEEDTAPLNLPVYYSYGLSVLLSNSIGGGKILCTNESVLSRNFWEQFKQSGCNSFAGVPYTYEMLRRIGFEKMEGLHLKYFTQAGGKMDVKLRKVFADYAVEHNCQFFVMYGQTEATARMSYLGPQYAYSKIEAIGKPIPGGKFMLDEQTGELVYEGRNVFKGYAYNANDLQGIENILALRTGDLARVDEEGFYYITGRLNRFIKLYGNRVGLDEVEQQLRKKFDGTIGCTGVNDQFLLIFSDNAALDANEVRNYVSGIFGLHISALRFKLVEPIPLNA
ncbi:MAG TPA: AMP-binding protein, partial [Chitinophagales bacterium]|nr:AMP-binding protein [Chitinophagales bacterium]